MSEINPGHYDEVYKANHFAGQLCYLLAVFSLFILDMQCCCWVIHMHLAVVNTACVPVYWVFSSA